MTPSVINKKDLPDIFWIMVVLESDNARTRLELKERENSLFLKSDDPEEVEDAKSYLDYLREEIKAREILISLVDCKYEEYKKFRSENEWLFADLNPFLQKGEGL